MSRLVLVWIAILAMFAIVLAQDSSSSSSSSIVDSSSSSAMAMDSSSSSALSSSSEAVADSSSSSAMTIDSSSSSEVVVDSSSSTIVTDSSSTADNMESSSSMFIDSSSAGNGLPLFLPEDWESRGAYDNNTVFNVTWGPKSNENLMKDFGIADGFIIDGESGRFLKLIYGNMYTFLIDSSVPSDFYLTTIPEGNQALGNITIPIVPGSNLTYVAGADASSFVIYYASTTDSFAGGTIAFTQAATALQVSFLVMAISAFMALVFPKW